MGSGQLITVPNYNWVIITSNNLRGVVKKNAFCGILLDEIELNSDFKPSNRPLN